MTEDTLLSVGIDLGTTTTQLVFSRLHLHNAAGAFQVPDVQIREKELLYESPVHFTPLLSDTVIDAGGVRRIVEAEYAAAGVDKAQVQTGAVIITGETARKENAREVLRSLAGFAGDFVVATAGPDLESILAGAGAGAEEYAQKHGCRLLHIDIGGGTANLVLYEDGDAAATSCLNVGGRLVKTESGRVTYLSPVLSGLTELSVGDPATEETLQPVVRLLTRALEDMVLGDPENIPPQLRTTALMELGTPPEAVSFSGGVAELIYADTLPEPFFFGDIGVLLARCIRESPLMKKALPRLRQTIRATVVGAGSHSTRLSGSTIDYEGVEFPMKNLPAAVLSHAEQRSPAEAVSKRLAPFRASGEDRVVIYLPGLEAPGFGEVQTIAEGLLQGAGDTAPLLVAVGTDMAKALGQAIRARRPQLPFLCLDGVRLRPGAYLDIGPPTAEGRVLPVIIKTLVF